MTPKLNETERPNCQKTARVCEAVVWMNIVGIILKFCNCNFNHFQVDCPHLLQFPIIILLSIVVANNVQDVTKRHP